MTGIQWTEETWNPTTGCDRVSAGCDHCYALTMAARLKGMGSAKYQRDGDPKTSGPGFGLSMHPDTLDTPLRWKKPRKVFVNSMSDLFHDQVTDEFIAEVWSVMARTPQHAYQILTKRHGCMKALLNRPSFRDNLAHLAPWPLPNVWLGHSAEDQQYASLRIPALLNTPAAVRFLSCEPLLGSIDLRNLNARNGALIDCLSGDVKTASGGVYAACPSAIDWVIVGGESGRGSRPMELAWAQLIVDQCRASRVSVFVKQLGSVWAHEAGVGGKGGEPDCWPEDLRVREFPLAVTP